MASKSDPSFHVENKNCVEGHIYEIVCSEVIWIRPEETITYPIKFDFNFHPDQNFIEIILPAQKVANDIDIKPLYVLPTDKEVLLSIENIGEGVLRFGTGENLGVLIVQRKVKDYSDEYKR